MVWLNSKFQVDYIEERRELLASSRGCRFEPQQRRCVVALNIYLINCFVLVQPDFEINENLNSVIIVCVCVGGGGCMLEMYSLGGLLNIAPLHHPNRCACFHLVIF